MDLTPVGHQIAGDLRIGEERHRSDGTDEDQMFRASQLGLGEFGQVTQSVDGRESGAAFEGRRERLAQKARPRRGRHPAGCHQPGPTGGAASQKNCRRLARPQRLGRLFHRIGSHRPRPRGDHSSDRSPRRRTAGDIGHLGPREIGWHHQRGHPTGRPVGGEHGVHRVAGQSVR